MLKYLPQKLCIYIIAECQSYIWTWLFVRIARNFAPGINALFPRGLDAAASFAAAAAAVVSPLLCKRN